MSARNRAYESALERRLRGAVRVPIVGGFLVPNGTNVFRSSDESLAGCEDGALPFTSLLKDVGIRG